MNYAETIPEIYNNTKKKNKKCLYTYGDRKEILLFL